MKPFLFKIIVAVVLTGLVSCTSMTGRTSGKGKPVTAVQFSGASAKIKTPEGYQAVIYSSQENGMGRGLSENVARSVFSQFAIHDCGCVLDPHNDKFWCTKDKCQGSIGCIVHSAKNNEDFSDERREPPGEDGKVWYLPGRIYWCECEG